MRRPVLMAAWLASAMVAGDAVAHPLDGLSAEEYRRVTEILRGAELAADDTLYPLIELLEPAKAEVLAWTDGDELDRRATAHFTTAGGFTSAVVNITQGTVESAEPAGGQPMVLFSEFVSAMEVALGHPEMVAGLESRGLTPDDVFCLPLTAGNFLTDDYVGSRLMKVPCYVNPQGSNFYAKPIEGLYAVVDLATREVRRVVDEGAVALPTDPWGYTEEEVEARLPLRPQSRAAQLSQDGGPNFTIDGSQISWDIWRMRYRVDKRPGLVLSGIEVNDGGDWRSVLYQAHLSEVFVPYMDPSEGWYWRTYMDSGEYGFGLFLTPLTPGIDCPAYATFLPAVINDDLGNPLEIPDAICIFERSIGDPAWRHFEIFAQSEEKFVPAEGRPATELVVRTASEVGNYDYLIDYRFHPDGQMFIKIGATGLDAVKGVATTSMDDATAGADTAYGTLIAPHVVAANHDHYFNFRLDFDIDQPANHFAVMEIVPGEVPDDSPRRSLWQVRHSMPASELEARYQISAQTPRYFHISNTARQGPLGHHPGYMIHHGSIAYGPFDFADDPPMKRNAYIEHSVWNTVYDPSQRYAGGNFPMQSDGSDTLATWVEADRPLIGQDVVTWFTAGFHHIPRMEDWPVMSTDWKTVHIMPHNFFPHNPALTLRKGD